MNRTPATAIARDVAQFLIDKKVNPLHITAAQYDNLAPPYRAIRMKLYFLTFARAMKHVASQVERLQKRTVVKKPIKAKEKQANGEV